MDEIEVKIKEYNERGIDHLKGVTLNWAYGKDEKYLQDGGQSSSAGVYNIYIVNLAELIDKSEFLGFDPSVLFIGEYGSDSKIVTTLTQWENGGFIDPPTVTIYPYKTNKVSITDGRHRTKLAYHLGCENIPIAIHTSIVSKIREIIELKTV